MPSSYRSFSTATPTTKRQLHPGGCASGPRLGRAWVWLRSVGVMCTNVIVIDDIIQPKLETLTFFA